MAETDALTLLEKRLGSPSDVDVAANLVRALDFVPLAISQATAYIQARAPRSSLPQYLAEFRESERKRIRLLGHDAGDLRRDGGASNSIVTTWQISFDHIRSKSPSAADLLSLMSFFDRQGIPESLLKITNEARDAARAGGPDEAEDSESDGSGSDTDSSMDGEFEDDVATLRAYCLVIPNDKGDEFEMHRLVQLSTRKWLETRGWQEKFKQRYITLMAASFPTGDYSNWATCQRLFAHVEVAVNYRPGDGRLEEWAGLLYNGGWYALSQGRYDIAERMAREARRACEKAMGKDDEAALDSTSLFAQVLLDRGLYKEAEELFVQVMETCKTRLGADHPSTLTSMCNLVLIWKGQGRYAKAVELMEACAQRRASVLGINHPYTRGSSTTLAKWRNEKPGTGAADVASHATVNSWDI